MSFSLRGRVVLRVEVFRFRVGCCLKYFGVGLSCGLTSNRIVGFGSGTPDPYRTLEYSYMKCLWEGYVRNKRLETTILRYRTIRRYSNYFTQSSFSPCVSKMTVIYETKVLIHFYSWFHKILTGDKLKTLSDFLRKLLYHFVFFTVRYFSTFNLNYIFIKSVPY